MHEVELALVCWYTPGSKYLLRKYSGWVLRVQIPSVDVLGALEGYIMVYHSELEKCGGRSGKPGGCHMLPLQALAPDWVRLPLPALAPD